MAVMGLVLGQSWMVVPTSTLPLKKKGSIQPELYNHLCSSGGWTPLLYGMTKVHKPDLPLRPLVQSLTYQLSKQLSKPLIGNTTSRIWNSAEFASFIRSKSLDANKVLVPFVVVSPIELAVDIARHKLETDTSLGSPTSLGQSDC